MDILTLLIMQDTNPINQSLPNQPQQPLNNDMNNGVNNDLPAVNNGINNQVNNVADFNQQPVQSNTVSNQQAPMPVQPVITENNQPVTSNTIPAQDTFLQPQLPDVPFMAPVNTAPPSGKPVVLIVEDEKDALDLYVYSIQSIGEFEVLSASDGEEALMQLSQHRVDLVLLDIMMPKKDGVETLAELKKNTQLYGTPKVVMLTNIGGDIAIDKAMSLGAEGYMLKSEVEPLELIGIIKQYLNIR